MQDRAPEALQITVQTVKAPSIVRPFDAMRPGGTETVLDVTLTARVDTVLRTASNLTPGSIITIRYTVKQYQPIAPPGGRSPALLKVGEKAQAFLRRSEAGPYDVAAEGESLLVQ